MKVVHVAFECTPIYKTGGLADVVGSLPIALNKLGVDMAVIMPGYGWINKIAHLPNSPVPVYFVDSPYFAKHNLTHDKNIQAPKYAHFALLTLEFLKTRKIQPDIIHCHDWHTGLIPYILYTKADPFFSHTKTILTIHNVGYQGEFPSEFLNTPETKQLLELIANHPQTLSFLKMGISSADYISTVSENHAEEIKSGIADFGLKELIKLKSDNFSGILNGIDYRLWNSKNDRLLIKNYGSLDFVKGKLTNKLDLQSRLNLRVDKKLPLFGFIARLTKQKGVELVISLVQYAFEKKLQLILLGTGDKEYEEKLKAIVNSETHPYLSVNMGFNESLAHKIYAAADFFLVPSHYEPCGLTQMIAMRYGSVPIASNVGGLKDSIVDGENGLLFSEINESGFFAQIDRALKLWQNPQLLNVIQQKAMKTNFSWTRSALRYLNLYKKLLS